MTNIKAGMLFKDKDNRIYLVADSSNQRWIIDILKGNAKWFFKANAGTIEEAKTRGYEYFSTTEELLSTETKKPVAVVSTEIKKSDAGDAPDYYNPLTQFEELMKGILKI